MITRIPIFLLLLLSTVPYGTPISNSFVDFGVGYITHRNGWLRRKKHHTSTMMMMMIMMIMIIMMMMMIGTEENQIYSINSSSPLSFFLVVRFHFPGTTPVASIVPLSPSSTPVLYTRTLIRTVSYIRTNSS